MTDVADEENTVHYIDKCGYARINAVITDNLVHDHEKRTAVVKL